MQLDLVNCWHDANSLTKISKDMRIEITDPNSSNKSLVMRLFHGPIGTIIVPHGLMDQVKIQIIKIQLIKGNLQASLAFS